MKHFEKVTETVTKTHYKLIRRSCDLCGVSTVDDGNRWTTISFEEDNVEKEVDICPDCFKNKLVPWLISQGAKIKQEDWDW